MTPKVSPAPKSLVARVREQLHALESDFEEMLRQRRLWCFERDVYEHNAHTAVKCSNPTCSHTTQWAPEGPEGVVARMLLSERLLEASIPHHALYSVKVTEVDGLLHGYAVLQNLATDVGQYMNGGRGQPERSRVEAFKGLFASLDYLPKEKVALRVVIDTSSLMDDADVARFQDTLGKAYTVHLVPQVLHEVDRLKDLGSDAQREQALSVDRRLKGYRDSADVRSGAVVEGGIEVIFDFKEPRHVGLPGWLDLAVPDDRVIASTIELQYRNPRSAVIIGSRDNGMLSKAAGAGIPYFRTDLPKGAGKSKPTAGRGTAPSS